MRQICSGQKHSGDYNLALKVSKEVEDVRGKIIWIESSAKEIHLVETNKGYARGGHYHPFPSSHHIISGLVLYKETDMKSHHEVEKRYGPGCVINTAPNVAHIMIALEDTIFVEIFDPPYEAEVFPLYRQVVEKTISGS